VHLPRLKGYERRRIFTHTHTHTNTHTHTHTRTHTHTHIFRPLGTKNKNSVPFEMYCNCDRAPYIYIYICMYIYTYIHTKVSALVCLLYKAVSALTFQNFCRLRQRILEIEAHVASLAGTDSGKVLPRVAFHIENTRALTFENLRCAMTVGIYSKCTRELTFGECRRRSQSPLCSCCGSVPLPDTRPPDAGELFVAPGPRCGPHVLNQSDFGPRCTLCYSLHFYIDCPPLRPPPFCLFG